MWLWQEEQWAWPEVGQTVQLLVWPWVRLGVQSRDWFGVALMGGVGQRAWLGQCRPRLSRERETSR